MRLFGGITIPGAPDLENVSKLDTLPIPLIRRMHRYGIAIDTEYFRMLTADLRREMDDLRRDICCEIPPDKLDMFIGMSNQVDDWSPINVESGEQLAKLMFDVLGVGIGRQLKLTKGGKRISTGKKQLELLKNDHPVIPMILNYRERSKMVNTYTDKLPRIAILHPKSKCCPVCELPHVEATRRIHTTFTTTRTDTGRLASKEPNLQNIPARTEIGRRVRAGFIASPGTRLIGRDFGQIELRLLAHAAVEHALIDIFRKKQDPHTITAMRAFHKTKEEVEKGQGKLLYRAPCKNVNFGIVYGLSAPGLYDLMAVTYATAGLPMPDWLTQDWCDRFIRDWFALYPEVKAYMELQYYRARRYGIVWDMFGRIRRVPEVRSVHSWIRAAGLRQAGNMPIQSDSAGLMKLSMGELEERVIVMLEMGYWVWPLLSIHDELIVEGGEDEAEEISAVMGGVMEEVLVDRDSGKNMLRVPVTSDGKVMERWVKE